MFNIIEIYGKLFSYNFDINQNKYFLLHKAINESFSTIYYIEQTVQNSKYFKIEFRFI